MPTTKHQGHLLTPVTAQERTQLQRNDDSRERYETDGIEEEDSSVDRDNNSIEVTSDYLGRP